jgi:hypothetical protein
VWEHRAAGRWKAGLGGHAIPPLYRLDEVRAAMGRGDPIVVVEGEKDADRLWTEGIAATTSPHGAAAVGQKAKWTGVNAEPLMGATVVLLGDNDDAGRAHMDAAAATLLRIARVRRIELADHWPEIRAGEDVSDWLDDGGRIEDLRKWISEARPIGAKPIVVRPLAGHGGLEGQRFMELEWIVPAFIPEGLTLLAGKPKVGKSWLALAISAALTQVGRAVLDTGCKKRGVIYCALEDTPRRMQARSRIVFEPGWPDTMFSIYELPTIDDGLIDHFHEYRRRHPEIGVIIVDTLAAIRGQKKNGEEQYGADYRAMKALLEFSHATGVAVIVIHHVRKQEAADIFDTISGTLGLNGAADTLAVLSKTDEQLRLAVRGRDVEEIDKVVNFDGTTGYWSVVEDYVADKPAANGIKAAIVMALAGYGSSGSSPADIANKTGMPVQNVQKMLQRMAKTGEIRKTQYGTYAPL